MNNSNPIRELTEYLNKVKMVYSSLKSVQLKDFKEIEGLVNNLRQTGELEEGGALVNDFLMSNPRIYLVEYFLVLINHYQGKAIDQDLKIILDELEKNRHGNIGLIILQTLLQINSTYSILLLLAKFAGKYGEEGEIVDIWKELLKKDSSQFEIALKLATKLEKQHPEEAIYYYQLVLSKSFEMSQYGESLEALKCLIQMKPDHYTGLITWTKKITNKTAREAQYKQELLDVYATQLKAGEFSEEKGRYQIEIYKIALENSLEIPQLKSGLLKLLKSLHQNQFTDYFLKISSLKSALLNFEENPGKYPPSKILDCLVDFEKKIQYDIGKYIKHQSFGTGLITNLVIPEKKATERPTQIGRAGQGNELTLQINFNNKKNHEMSFRIAVNSLQVLKSNNLKALKIFNQKSLEDILNGDEFELVKAILDDLDQEGSLKDIKEYLERVYPAEGLSKKWTSIKKTIISDQRIELNEKKYRIRKEPVSFLEEALYNLERTNQLKNQFKIIDLFYTYHDNNKDDNLLLKKSINEKVLANSDNPLLLQFVKHYLGDSYPHIFEEYTDVTSSITSYQLQEEEVEGALVELDSVPLKNRFLAFIFQSQNFSDFINKFIQKVGLRNKVLIIHFISKHDSNLLLSIYNQVKKSYHSEPELYILLISSIWTDSKQQAEKDGYDMVANLTKLWSEIYIKLDQNSQSKNHKYLFLEIQKILFENKMLESFMLENKTVDGETKRKLMKEVLALNFLENYLKLEAYQVEEKIVS